MVALCASAMLAPVWAQDETAPQRRPVKVVAPDRIKIKTVAGEALVPAFTSGDLTRVHADVRRAVIVVHGRLRDADKYFELSMRAARASNALGDTLLIAPQIVSSGDAARHDLPASVARWKSESWLGGDAGKAPFPISSFEVIDGIIAQLSDRTRFPNLERIVVAAHSGGAQYVQRYAVVGRADQVITSAGLQPYAEGAEVNAAKGPVMRVRYVVANPSSYVYFDPVRPVAVSHCREVDHWRYGINDPVAYAQGGDMKVMESRYLTRRVIYLLGGNDIDPNHSALDKSCMAAAQGSNRLERGTHYFAHLLKRAKLQGIALRHTRVEVPGVAHDADRMFNSICGKAALFDAPGCEMKLGESMTAPSAAAAALAPVATPSLPAAPATHAAPAPVAATVPPPPVARPLHSAVQK
jgi:hypothetical protein